MIGFGDIQLVLTASWVFLFAVMGELFNQRSGVLNIGIEGMMLVGALVSIITSGLTGNPWIGVLGGMVAGGGLGLFHGVLSISLRVDQVVSGVGIWILGLSSTTYFGAPYIGPVENSIETVIGGFTPLFYVGLLLVPLVWFVLFKTNFGLRVRTTGEDPSVAEASGINVVKIRYICVLFGGLMSGLSGAYLALVYTPVWSQAMTAGRGWIALSIIFFSFWRPFLGLLGSLFFGTLWISSISLQGVIPGVSTNMLKILPYLLTVVALVILSLERFRMRLGPPATLGEPYFPEE